MRAATSLIAGLGQPQNLLSIANPQNSGVVVVLLDLDVCGVPTGVAAAPFLYRYGRTTGALPSGGTVLTAQKDSSSEGDPQAVLRQGPTSATAAAGSMWVGSPGVLLSGVLLGAPVAAYQALLEPIVASAATHVELAPGEAILVQADSNLTTWNHSVVIQWRECPQ